jgi:hypothetical protein
MPRRLLRKHPHISMFSQLTDAHLYVIRKWVIYYLAYEKWVYKDIPFTHYSSNDYISALGFLDTINAGNWVTEIKCPVSNITPLLCLSLPRSPSLHYLFYEEMHLVTLFCSVTAVWFGISQSNYTVSHTS